MATLIYNGKSDGTLYVTYNGKNYQVTEQKMADLIEKAGGLDDAEPVSDGTYQVTLGGETVTGTLQRSDAEPVEPEPSPELEVISAPVEIVEPEPPTTVALPDTAEGGPPDPPDVPAS